MDREDALVVIISALIALVASFLIMCGFVWLLCYILSIFGVVVEFSIKLVLAVWAAFIIIRLFFKGVPKE